MDVAITPAAERIARVLAGRRISANADGDEDSARDLVERAWKDHLDDAVAVLHTLRAPDEAMAAAGDPAVWERMILVAIEEARPRTVVL
ncbi:hypothetical protein G4G27_21085 [Sphingomonas sp. So64.6b]|uniref:hypothetical protein n=1 Tax=Sphingomonas sp. So64.6b TaxID=2997354 RepID=UPI0015FF0684|nr:hypothetical protein [Sphingomonas sp. So64.6b]QNA86199.1 hypothetical protein G4G27_21085 [Sphingomonas sp. So64.6b]